MLYLLCCEKRNGLTLRNRCSYLFLCVMQCAICYPKTRSVLLEYNLNCIGWVLAILTNAFLYSLLPLLVLEMRKRCVLPRKLFDRFSVLHIITQLLFVIFFVLSDWDGDYIEVVNCIIIMYHGLWIFRVFSVFRGLGNSMYSCAFAV